MPRRSTRRRRHSIHPSNESNNNNTTDSSTNQNLSPTDTPIAITTNPLTTAAIPPPDPASISSSVLSINNTDDNSVRQNITTSQLVTNLVAPNTTLTSNRSSPSLFAKLTDAKKSLFGRANTPDPFFSAADENKALLDYILSATDPQLNIIQDYEHNGAQLNAVTEEGNNSIHLLAIANNRSTECINIIDYLIKKDCDPNRQNDYGWTAAHYALATSNTDLATYLFRLMIDVNLVSCDAHNGYPSHTQLLHIAARQNDSALIRLLIRTYRARINAFDEDGCTPLHICCYENNLDGLKTLLENDADFQRGTRLNPNETPIGICVKYQHDQCLKLIFDLTINFNWKRYFSQLPRSPLLCDFPSIYAIESLIEHGLDIDACDERGNTFIHYLVNKRDIDYEKYFEILIRVSADFNRQNRLGRTPFLEALEQKHFQLIAVFFHHIEIININIVDSLSNTALHYCKYLNENMIFNTILQLNPLALNAQNRDGQTPLHAAILCDNYSFARYLLQRGADLTIVNKDGNTPLHLAARDDNTKMCKLLMKYPQIDLIAVNKMGKTPLHLACANEKTNVAAILINKLKMEELNLLDFQGRTPLHECSDNLTGSLARYLIRHGADENAKDSQQNNVLHLTTEKGNIELVRTLIKSSNIDINQLNVSTQSALGLAILYNHDDVSRYLLSQETIRIQSTDLKMAMQMNNYEIVKLLIEKDRNCLRVRSSTHGDMIIHVYMRRNFNNLVCLETLLSFISDNDLLGYLSEGSLAYGDNLLHIAAREDTPNALTCFLNISRVKFWFWANMMLTKNNENKTPMELANEFKHYAIIKLINSKWKESYEYLSHSLRDGHCGVSSAGVTESKRQCPNCNQTGLIDITPGQTIRPCSKCNVCLYKSLDNSMQIFLALLFSDESSTIALDIMDSLIVINEVQKAVHLYLDHIEPWEEFDKVDLNDSSSLLAQLVYTSDGRKQKGKDSSKDTISTLPLAQVNPGSSIPSTLPQNNISRTNLVGSNLQNTTAGPRTNPPYLSQTSVTTKYRPDGTFYRPITPLEALYYHERLDLITHPLIKGLIKWKWDNYAAKHFYLSLLREIIFLILWTCTSLIVAFPIRYVYRFPQDIWRCFLWAASIGLLLWGIVNELFDMSYARKRYADYLIWETERTQNRLYLISKNKYKPNTNIQSTNIGLGKNESLIKTDNTTKNTEQLTVDETVPTTMASNINLPGIRSHHSQHNPLPQTIPTIIKGKPSEPQPNQQRPIDVPSNSSDLVFGSKKMNGSFPSEKKSPKPPSRFVRFLRRYQTRIKARLKSYYMYYSLNNLFDWIVYMLCLITVITHFIDVSSHTVTRARVHMYIASVTVICIWFRFMVFFRTMSITAKTLRSKIVEIKLGELVIMVRMMFDDIIRFLLVFIFLLAPYAFVFFAVFGGRQIIHDDYRQTPKLCETALLYCPITEIRPEYDGTRDSLEAPSQFIFNGTSSNGDDDLCHNATALCRVVETDGFETFYSLLFAIFQIALVDNTPINSFNLIDHYFAAFVCGTYLLFTAILSINIFIGLISNALQTEAFSTVEARFLLERIEAILNYEWRLSIRKRLQLQEIIHRQCAPLQLNWKEINFAAFGQTREEQQAKAFANFRQTIEKHNIQFDTFRIQVQQKLNDIESTLTKLQSTPPPPPPPSSTATATHKLTPPAIVVHKSTPETPIIPESTTNIIEELARLRELLEETLVGHSDRPITTTGRAIRHHPSIDTPSTITTTTDIHHDTPLQVFSQNINERVTDLQSSVNRLHQDVTGIRQILERTPPLSTSLVLGRTTGRK